VPGLAYKYISYWSSSVIVGKVIVPEYDLPIKTSSNLVLATWKELVVKL